MKEMNEEKNSRGSIVLLTVIAIATLLVAIVGATFAYFTVTISGNDTATSILVKTATLGITYTDGQAIVAENIVPGQAIPTRTFTIRNTSTIAMTYHVDWIEVINDRVDNSGAQVPFQDLVFTVVGTITEQRTNLSDPAGTPQSITTPTNVPTTSGRMLSNMTIAPGETHSFTLTLTFPELGVPQDYDQGKVFSARIQVAADGVSQ